MALESGTYISDLVATNPVGATDQKSQGDDHIRLLKSTIKNTFPNINGAVTLTDEQINALPREDTINAWTEQQGMTETDVPQLVMTNLGTAQFLARAFDVISARPSFFMRDTTASSYSAFTEVQGNVLTIFGTQAADGTGLTAQLSLDLQSGDLAIAGDFTGNVAPLRDYLEGFGISNSVGDTINDITFAAGFCADSTNTAYISGGALTKRLDANWAVGDAQGMLDTGAVADGTYHLFTIKRPDTGVVDYLASTSLLSPTLPTNYTQFRRVGSIVRESGTIRPFIQKGNVFLWATPGTLVGANPDVSVTNLSTAGILYPLIVPTGIKAEAMFRSRGTHGSAGWGILFSSPDTTDIAPSLSGAPGADLAGASTEVDRGVNTVRTDSSGRIRARSTQSSTSLVMVTYGFIDDRGRG